MNVNVARWVTASLAVAVKAEVDSMTGVQFALGGVTQERSSLFRNDSVVLRVTGPIVKYGSSVTRYKFEAMALITELLTSSDNGYQLLNRAGSIANVLSGPVAVLNHPDTTQVGCLDADRDADQFLRVLPLGKLNKDQEIHQAAVIARYEICLDS